MDVFNSLAICPAGSYYSTKVNTCAKCPLGTYQPAQGQTECIFCGGNLTTAFNGTVKESDCIGNLFLNHSYFHVGFKKMFSE